MDNTLTWAFKILAIVFQVLIVVQITRQLFWPLRFPLWEYAWLMFLAAMLTSLARRIYDFFQEGDPWSILISLLVNMFLFVSIALLARIFRQPVVPTPLPPPAHIHIDTHSLVLYWDRTAQGLFGWSQGEAVGRQLEDLIIPVRDHAKHQAGMQRYLVTGSSEMIGRRILATARHKDGHEMPIELEITAVTTPAGEQYFQAELRRLVTL